MLGAAEHRLEFLSRRFFFSILHVAFGGSDVSAGQNPAPPSPAPAHQRLLHLLPPQSDATLRLLRRRLLLHPRTRTIRPIRMPWKSPPMTPRRHSKCASMKCRCASLCAMKVGKIIPDLKKEDFQLFDNRKPQAITSFRIETPELNAAKTQGHHDGNPLMVGRRRLRPFRLCRNVLWRLFLTTPI